MTIFVDVSFYITTKNWHMTLNIIFSVVRKGGRGRGGGCYKGGRRSEGLDGSDLTSHYDMIVCLCFLK